MTPLAALLARLLPARFMPPALTLFYIAMIISVFVLLEHRPIDPLYLDIGR